MDNFGSTFDELKTYFGEVTQEEYEVLLKEYGGKEDGMIELIYEALDESSLSLSELVLKLINKSHVVAVASAAGAAVDSFPTEPIPDKLITSLPPVLRHPAGMEVSKVKLYLAEYLESPLMKTLFQELSQTQHTSSSSRGGGILILMRGASGSGKTTLANLIWSINTNTEICSVDQYFDNRSKAKYEFNRNFLSKANEDCIDDCKRSLACGVSPVIIDNPNIRIDQMIPYVDLAIEFNYDVKIVEPNTIKKKNSDELARASEVPKKKIVRQLEGFEEITESELTEKALRNHKNKINYCKVRGWNIEDSASQQSAGAKASFAKLQRIFHFEDKLKLKKIFKENDCNLTKCVTQLIHAGRALLTEEIGKANGTDEDGHCSKETFEMFLPKKFAKLLIQSFGVAEDKNFKIPPDMLKVEIDPDTAFYFFTKLYVNHVKAATTEATETNQVRYENVVIDQDEGQDEIEFELVLPTNFAKLLLQTYVEERDLTSYHALKIKISSETAFALFTKLYSNMNRATVKNVRKNENEEDTFSLEVIEAVTGESDSFAELLEELKTIKASIASYFTPYTAPHRNLEQQNNFLMIKQEFSHLDPFVVDEVFTQCFLDAAKTKEKLNELYPAAAGGIGAVPGSSSN